jgi:protein phosphatase 1 regulatory subunit 7
MKSSILFSLLLLQQICNAQVVRIPDPNFKQRVIALGFDTNGDNQIQASEAQKVTKLYVDNLGIVNLEGINQFTNLEELGCYNNLLASLDVSKLKKLKYLYAYNNKINTLNITGLTQLEHLYVQNNIFIASLDVSKMPDLKELYFSDNRITSLDVSGLNLLEKIEGENNRISTVALRKAPNLKSVNLKNNQMTITVDIRGLANLEYFNFEGSQLIVMNFTGTVKLKQYYW